MPFAFVTAALELTPGKFDIVELTGPHRAAPGRRNRPAGLGRGRARRLLRAGPGSERHGSGGSADCGWGLHLMEPAVDLDGDGTRDILVVAWQRQCVLRPVGQGRIGAMELRRRARTARAVRGQEGPNRARPARADGRAVRTLIGWPAIGDVDGDGTPDLIATMVFQEAPAEVQRRTGKPPTPMTPVFFRRIVVAISGRSGRSLWIFALDRTFTTNKARYWDRPAALLRGRASALVVILDGSQLNVLDLATGRPRSGPVELGFEPVRPPQFADLDGDGEPEILALGRGRRPISNRWPRMELSQENNCGVFRSPPNTRCRMSTAVIGTGRGWSSSRAVV